MSYVFEACIEGGERQRDVLLVAHADTRPLPEGSFELDDGRERVAVWAFPHDPFLPGLPSAIDPGRVRELLDTLDVPPGEVELATRAYRPTRRAVVEVTIHAPESTGRVLYLKLLRPGRARRLARVHRQLSEHLPVPRVVGVAREQGIVALEALPGPTLRSVLVGDGPLPDPAELVEISQRLARSGLTSRARPRAFADPTRHAGALAELVPDLAGVVRSIAQAAAELDGDEVPVHGDLHDGQLLVTDGRVSGVLDLDGAGDGLLAHDAGSLVAHLQAVGEKWPQLAERADAYAAAIADAYRPIVGDEALPRAAAGAWLGLATGPYRAQEPDWQEATRARIGRAQAVLRAADR